MKHQSNGDCGDDKRKPTYVLLFIIVESITLRRQFFSKIAIRKFDKNVVFTLISKFYFRLCFRNISEKDMAVVRITKWSMESVKVEYVNIIYLSISLVLLLNS